MKKFREDKDTFKILLKIIFKYFDEMTLQNLKTDQKYLSCESRCFLKVHTFLICEIEKNIN